MIIFNGACREERPSNRGQAGGFMGRHYGNAAILFLQYHVFLIRIMLSDQADSLKDYLKKLCFFSIMLF